MLLVSICNRNPGMATLAQRHEVTLVVRAAVCQRQDVMYFLDGRQPAFAHASFANRMRLDVKRSDSSPRASISFVCIWVAQVLVILTFGYLPVLVAEPTIGQPPAARIGAGTLGFVWHPIPPRHKKTTGDFSSMAFYTAILLYLKITSTLIYSHLLEPDE